MEIQLYVYDLSQGLARSLSQQFLGTQIDAVYHTSLVFEGIEYYYGQGIQTCAAGATHHGKPMEVIPLGQTALPVEIILEYLESLKGIYTPESYDLFLHNCNNFTNDFAMFLVGKGIPGHITSLPQTVLNTPFGQMLRPQLDRMMRPITQAPTPQPVAPTQPTVRPPQPTAPPKTSPLTGNTGIVNNVTTIREVDRLLGLAKDRSAIIFFTSATCPPCKLVYQPYDDLAAESSEKCIFIKVDFTLAERAIGSRFPSVRATPTFITFLRGQQRDEWSGADPRLLRTNVEMLIEAAFPTHPHLSKSVPTLLKQSQRPITYAKLPPLEKLIAKMGTAGQDPAVTSIVHFLTTRAQQGAIEAPLPPLPPFASWLQKSTTALPPDSLFAALDLLRVSLTDPRIAGFFAEEHGSGVPATIPHLLSHVSALGDTAPYSLRLTALHVSCNLFASPLFTPHLLAPPLATHLVTLLTTALLDDAHPALRTSALALAMNLAGANHKIRMRKHTRLAVPAAPVEEMPEDLQVEVLASLLEVLGVEGLGKEEWKMGVIAIGWLVYCAERGGEVADLCAVMAAGEVVGGSGSLGKGGVEERLLGREVGGLC